VIAENAETRMVGARHDTAGAAGQEKRNHPARGVSLLERREFYRRPDDCGGRWHDGANVADLGFSDSVRYAIWSRVRTRRLMV
jgi:hypothetical protein